MSRSGFRSGFVSIIGRPNVGKSTLLNQMIGEKIAIISDKPQTTRTRIMGVKHLEDAQIVFVDTPGIHKPKYALNSRMVRTALQTLEDVDLIFLVVEGMQDPGAGDQFIMDRLKGLPTPVFLIINKIDRVSKLQLLPLIEKYTHQFKFTEVVPVSALSGDNVDHLVEVVLKDLPEGEPIFPDDTLTDQPVRFIAAEIIREKILARTREELPFSVAVMVESYKEDEQKKMIEIHAVIYVERDSQKGIVIGKRGEMLKAVGTEARLELETFLGVKIFLQLWVKVNPDWRSKESVLNELGY